MSKYGWFHHGRHTCRLCRIVENGWFAVRFILVVALFGMLIDLIVGWL